MTSLMLMLFTMVSATVMGIGVIVALTISTGNAQHLLMGAGAGFVLAIPISWLVASQISRTTS